MQFRVVPRSPALMRRTVLRYQLRGARDYRHELLSGMEIHLYHSYLAVNSQCPDGSRIQRHISVPLGAMPATSAYVP